MPIYSERNNYTPVSNLALFAKLLEKIVFNQPLVHRANNSILEKKLQSGYRANHNTETVLFKVLLRIIVDANNVAVLLLLDSSVAFNTIDQEILKGLT